MKKPPYSLAPIRVSIVSGFSIKEKGLILESLTERSKATNYLISFCVCNFEAESLIDHNDDMTCASLNIIKITSDNEAIKKLDIKENRRVLGYASANNKYSMVTLIVDRIESDRCFKTILKHEIGHRLGLSHTMKGTLMYKHLTSDVSAVTDYDLWILIAQYRNWLVNLPI